MATVFCLAKICRSDTIKDMAVTTYLTTAELHDIVQYSVRPGMGDTREYEGSVRAHPYDKSRFLLITTEDPELSHFYEFRKADVVAIQRVREVVTKDGATMQVTSVAIRKGARGIEMNPFEVQ